MKVSITVQVQCVERELNMRKTLYPRWVESGKMSQQKAKREIDAMQATLETLKTLEPKQQKLF